MFPRNTWHVACTSEEIAEKPVRNVNLSPGWHALALVTRVGTSVSKPGVKSPADIVLYFSPAEGEPDPEGHILERAASLEASSPFARVWLGGFADLRNKVLKLEEENQKLLKEILKILKARELRRKKKEGK